MKTSAVLCGVANIRSLGALFMFAGCTSGPMRHSTLALESEDDAIPLGVAIPGYERPVLIPTPPPEYPWHLRRLGVDGSVELHVAIDETGRVTDAQVVSSSDKLFEEAALEAARKWTFKPAMQNGVAVASRACLPIQFAVND